MTPKIGFEMKGFCVTGRVMALARRIRHNPARFIRYAARDAQILKEKK